MTLLSLEAWKRGFGSSFVPACSVVSLDTKPSSEPLGRTHSSFSTSMTPMRASISASTAALSGKAMCDHGTRSSSYSCCTVLKRSIVNFCWSFSLV